MRFFFVIPILLGVFFLILPNTQCDALAIQNDALTIEIDALMIQNDALMTQKMMH
jgi:hypothetical protein